MAETGLTKSYALLAFPSLTCFKSKIVTVWVTRLCYPVTIVFALVQPSNIVVNKLSYNKA